MDHAIILISCSDQKGITAAVTQFVFANNGNIIHADQHIDEKNNVFFMRIEFSLQGFKVKKEAIAESFKPIAKKFAMAWELSFSGDRMRAAVFVSKPMHCLYDLLYKHKTGQLICDIPLIISNHSDAKEVAENFSVRFEEFPVTKTNRLTVEKRQLELLQKEKIDLIILARYHQILSKKLVDHYPHRIINIHHSFLPAFAGKNPYAQAYEKGVKIIGATSHYVTEKLDDGPIIEQDTVRISHRHNVAELKEKGEDLERIVLNRAVKLHLKRKILCYNNKTVIFD